MRIIFAGTPDFAAAHLQELLSQAEHELVAVYTQPDRRSGRGKKITPGPVKQLALDHLLPVFQPVSLRDEDAQTELEALRADIPNIDDLLELLRKASGEDESPSP